MRAQILNFKDMDKTQHKSGLWRHSRCLNLTDLLKLSVSLNFKAVIKRFIGTWMHRDCIHTAFLSGCVHLLTLHIYKVLSSLGHFMDYPHAYTRTSCRQHLSLISAWITYILNFLLVSHLLSWCLSYLGRTFCNTKNPTTFFKLLMKIFLWET